MKGSDDWIDGGVARLGAVVDISRCDIDDDDDHGNG